MQRAGLWLSPVASKAPVWGGRGCGMHTEVRPEVEIAGWWLQPWGDGEERSSLEQGLCKETEAQ